MANVSAIIFDYYETLGELSSQMRERVFDDLARGVGVDLPPTEAYRHWRELTVSDWKLRMDGLLLLDGPTPPYRDFWDIWREQTRQLFKQWGVDVPPEMGADAYADAHARAVVYPDVAPALERLHGRYRLGILSDADSDFLESSMRRNGLSFDAVVTSEELRAYKPHISLFREACARLGVEPSQAVYVGDSAWADVEGARNAGLQAVWINRHDAAWPEEIEAPAEVIRSLEELPGLLEPAS